MTDPPTAELLLVYTPILPLLVLFKTKRERRLRQEEQKEMQHLFIKKKVHKVLRVNKTLVPILITKKKTFFLRMNDTFTARILPYVTR